MAEDNLITTFPLGRILGGKSINNTSPGAKFKKNKKQTKYDVFRRKECVGTFTKDELCEYLDRPWDTIRAYINKDRKILLVYQIKSAKK